MRWAASVGVAARTSATWSTRVVSVSWPTAVTTGVRQAAMARTSPSSEKGSRSSTEPPPRATTMTSTAGSASRRRRPSITEAAAVGPCTAQLCISNRTAGHRRRAVTSTSRSAALSRPVITPTTAGAKGSGRLRTASKRPSAASSCRIRSMRASSSPRPTARISVARREKEPRAT